MSINPSPFYRVAGALVHTTRTIGSGLRVFVWGGLRDGAIDLQPLPRTLRTLTIVGFVLAVAFLLSTIVSEPLRQLGPRVNLSYPISNTRFAQAPAWLVPVSLAAIAIGWSYVLTGALRSHPLARWGTFFLFLFAAIDIISNGLLVLGNDKVALILMVLGCLLGLVICFIALPRKPRPLAIDFVVIASLTAAIFALAFRGAVMTELATGLPSTAPLITSVIGYTFLISVPLLIFAGVEMVSFALEASRWIVETVERFTTAWVAVMLLIVVLGFRLWQVVPQWLAVGVEGREWGAIAGAVLFCAGLTFIGHRRRWQPVGEPLPLVAIFVVIVLLVFSLRLALMVVPMVYSMALFATRETTWAAEEVSRLNATITAISAAEVEHRSLITAVTGLVLAWFTRRRSPALATFGLILAWQEGLFWLSSAERPLAALSTSGADVRAVLLISFAALTIIWLWRRKMTPARALGLLGATALLWLVSEKDFLDNPFSPLFQLAGMSILVFALGWSLISAGKYANVDTKSFPQSARLLIYLGYVLITVVTINWFSVIHEVWVLASQNGWTNEGFVAYGMALVYLTLVEGGQRLREPAA